MMEDFDEVGDFFGNDMFDEPTMAEEAEEDNAKDDVLQNLFDDENKEDEKKRKKKTVIPAASKLNEALLMGPKGVKFLEQLFKDFKPDVKGDPYVNLAAAMKKYEHWAHVMAPKFKFEDVVTQCEKLGDRRPVKVCMQKIRLGMPLTDAEYDEMYGTQDKEKEDTLIRDDENDLNPEEFTPNAFRSPPPSPSPPPYIPSQQFSSSVTVPATVPPPMVSEAPKVSAPSLSEEERKKIAEKRMQAMELREKKRKEKEEMEKAAAEAAAMQEAAEADQMMDEDAVLAEFGL